MKYLFCTFLFFCSFSNAASFDCSKAATKIEKNICSDSDLSVLDETLGKSYKTALNEIEEDVLKHVLVNDQKAWLSYTRNICDDVNCLKQAYIKRIEELKSSNHNIEDISEKKFKDGFSYYLLTLHNPNERIDSFNRSLALSKNQGKIAGCELLIDLPVGTAHGNDSYGAFCKLINGTEKLDVQICNDKMIGHFGLMKIDRKKVDKQTLIDFTMENCFGG